MKVQAHRSATDRLGAAIAKVASIALGAAVCGLSGCVSTSSKQANQPIHADCLPRPSPDQWSPLDSQHLVLFGPGRKNAYLALLSVPNPDMMFGAGVAIADDDRDGQICGGSLDAVTFGTRSSVPGSARIVSMKRIDKAQAENLISLSGSKDKGALAAAIKAISQP